MVEKSIKKDAKRLSKGKRTHVRRLKQLARKETLIVEVKK